MYVNVWGGIIGDRRTPLIRIRRTLTAQTYIEDILTDVVLPFIAEQHIGRGILQQDNSPVHKSNTVVIFLQENNIEVLPWPAVSPDMNCIEHVWAILGMELLKLKPQPQNSEELFNALLVAWEAIDPQVIRNLTSKMRKRVNWLKQQNGCHTKF